MNDSDDVAPPQLSAVIAERVEAARTRKISVAQWDVLNCIRRNNWAAHALELTQVNALNYRARISELRQDFGIVIEADPPHPPRGTASTYKVPPEYRPRAEYLLEHLSLEGFSDAPVQASLFKA
jgi:hypothetical protein